MDGSKIFVGAISFRTTGEDLRDAFDAHGEGAISFRNTEDGLRDAFAMHGEVIDTKHLLDCETTLSWLWICSLLYKGRCRHSSL